LGVLSVLILPDISPGRYNYRVLCTMTTERERRTFDADFEKEAEVFL
jgi:hypothetical protein